VILRYVRPIMHHLSMLVQLYDRLCHGNRQFVTCLLPWLPAFHPTPVDMGFVVCKVVSGHIFLLMCSFPVFIIIQSLLPYTFDQLCRILVTDSDTEYPKHTHRGVRRDLWLQSSWNVKRLLLTGSVTHRICYSQDQGSPVHCQ
jgi:hypothetical protein